MKKKLKIISQVRRYSWIIVSLLLCNSCRVVPIQMVRVTQSESYIQTFTALKVTDQNVDDPMVSNLSDQNKKIDDTFDKLLGNSNWQNIKDLYGLKGIRDDLLTGGVFVKGLFSFSLSINPLDQSEFLLDGAGRFFIVKEDEDLIMLSGDFNIPLQTHLINELDKGYIIVDVELYTTRVPERVTFIHQVGLKYVIKMDTTLNRSGIYSLDYEQLHDVYLIDNPAQDVFEHGELIGELKLQGTNGTKYIDLRGMRFLRNDYLKKRTKANKIGK